MTKLSKRQREKRDELSAWGSISMAHRDGKTVGIAVDDNAKADKMLKRVERIAAKRGLQADVDKKGRIYDVKIGAGVVRIIPVMEEPTQH